MSIRGSFKVAVVFKVAADGDPHMVIRADAITATPDGMLQVIGDRQGRRFTPDMWKSITIENDGGESGVEMIDA